MINPTHRLKKFVKYSGNGKADDYHVTKVRGWLGSGVTDCNGVEIFEGDIVRNCFNAAVVEFKDGSFCVNGELLSTYAREDVELKVIGHVATEEDDNDNRT